MNVYVYGAKGGQGTSTVAACIALDYARGGCSVDLVGGGDLYAILGRPNGEGPIHLGNSAASGHPPVVVTDGGTTPPRPMVAPCASVRPVSNIDETYLVLRGPCYLGLRRALESGYRPDGVILLREPGRSLGPDDVRDVLGVRVVAELEVSPQWARAIDAGLLEHRRPGRGTFTFPNMVTGTVAAL